MVTSREAILCSISLIRSGLWMVPFQVAVPDFHHLFQGGDQTLQTSNAIVGLHSQGRRRRTGPSITASVGNGWV